MLRPMIPLAFGVAIFDEPARLARLEADGTPLLLAALGAAGGCCHSTARYSYFTLHFFYALPLWFGGTSAQERG